MVEEVQRYNLALTKLGYIHKGSFNLAEHDFTLDNYAAVGSCQVMLTLDSIKVLDCQKLELWEVESTDYFDDDDLLDKTITTLKKLQNV